MLGVSNVCLPINKKKKFQTGSVRGMHNVMPLYVALDLYGDGSMMDCVIICVKSASFKSQSQSKELCTLFGGCVLRLLYH